MNKLICNLLKPNTVPNSRFCLIKNQRLFLNDHKNKDYLMNIDYLS